MQWDVIISKTNTMITDYGLETCVMITGYVWKCNAIVPGYGWKYMQR